jgi:hypothetical protein
MVRTKSSTMCRASPWWGAWRTRRKFFEAKVSDKAMAEEALSLFGKVYAVEKHIREAGLIGEEKLAWRQTHAVPALAELHKWLTEKYADATDIPHAPGHRIHPQALGQTFALCIHGSAGPR